MVMLLPAELHSLSLQQFMLMLLPAELHSLSLQQFMLMHLPAEVHSHCYADSTSSRRISLYLMSPFCTLLSCETRNNKRYQAKTAA